MLRKPATHCLPLSITAIIINQRHCFFPRRASRTNLAQRCKSAFASVADSEDMGSFRPGPRRPRRGRRAPGTYDTMMGSRKFGKFVRQKDLCQTIRYLEQMLDKRLCIKKSNQKSGFFVLGAYLPISRQILVWVCSTWAPHGYAPKYFQKLSR